MPLHRLGKYLIALLCILPISACSIPRHVTRKSIEQLYHEAVSTSVSSRDAIFPTPASQRVPADKQEIIVASQKESVSVAHPVMTSARNRQPSMRRMEDQTKSLLKIEVPSESGTAGVVRPSSFEEILKGNSAETREPKKFEGNELRDAIRELADEFNVEVFVDETVAGAVNCKFIPESFEQSLELILTPFGYYFALRNDTYYVGPADPKNEIFPMISTMVQYEPLHLSTESLIAMLPEKQRGFVRSTEKKNLLLIEAPQALCDEIVTRFREVDIPVPQIQLEAIVCFISPDSGFRYGLDWNHAVKVEGQSSLSFGVSGLSFSGLASKNGYENAFSDFAVTSGFLKLLAQEGYLTLKAAPRVVARNGEKASISISRETYFSLQPTGTDIIFRQNVQTVNAGIKLDITPIIRGDTISIDIEKAEVSEDVRTNDVRPELTSNPYPIILRREVKTIVNVKDGQTIVIGGLVQRQTVERVNRVVGLSDIPMLGNLFRTVERQEQDVEVAIFISPRLVTEATSEPINASWQSSDHSQR